MLASIPSATLLGVDGQPVWVEVHVSERPPLLPRSSASPTRPAANRASVCAPRCCRRTSSSRSSASRSTSRPVDVRKTGAGLRARGRARPAARRVEPARGLPRRRRRPGRARARRLGPPRPRARSCSPTRCGAPGVETLIVPIGQRARRRRCCPDVQVRSGAHARRAARVPEGRARRGPTPIHRRARRQRATASSTTSRSTSPTSAASPPRRVALEVAAAGCAPPDPRRTARAPARRCSPAASPRSCRRSTRDEAFEVTRIQSVAGGVPPTRLARDRPFRAPHHTASTAALVGGGSARPAPGEVTRGAPRRAVPRRARRVPARARSTRSANRSRNGSCASRARRSTPGAPRRVPAHRVHQPVPVRARGRRVPLQRLAAGPLPAPAVRARCSTASTCGCASPGPQPGDGPGEPSAVVAARVLGRGRAATAPPARHAVAAQRARARGRARPVRRARPTRPPRRGGAWSRSSCSPGRGAARVRRVARTLADLDDRPDDHRRAHRARRVAAG